MNKENKGIMAEKCNRSDFGNLVQGDEEKKKAWKQYYERLLHAEFSWCEEDLSEVDPVLGPPPVITQEMVEKSISKMKKAKAPVPSGVV